MLSSLVSRRLLLLTAVITVLPAVYYLNLNTPRPATSVHLMRASGRQLPDFFAGLYPTPWLSEIALRRFKGQPSCQRQSAFGLDKLARLVGLGQVAYAQDNCIAGPCGNCNSAVTVDECRGSCAGGEEFDSTAPDPANNGVQTTGDVNCDTPGCGCQLDDCGC